MLARDLSVQSLLLAGHFLYDRPIAAAQWSKNVENSLGKNTNFPEHPVYEISQGTNNIVSYVGNEKVLDMFDVGWISSGNNILVV